MIKIVPECKTCNGFCCNYFIMPIKVHPKILEDYKKWLSYHGVKVIFHRGKYVIKIPLKCRFVLDDGKCSIFNTPERPNMCDISDCPKKDKEYISKL